MPWTIEFTDEFESWWDSLEAVEQSKVEAHVHALEVWGPDLPFPKSSGVKGSRHSHMRELRIQVKWRPFRVLYAFNPERGAILLLGGDKTGDNRWYEVNVPIADRLYDQHLNELKEERKKEAERDG